MRNAILLFLTVVLVIRCSQKGMESKPIYFPPEKIASLELSDLDGFWFKDSVVTAKPNSDVFFRSQSGYLAEVSFLSSDRNIVFAVFNSVDSASIALSSKFNHLAGPEFIGSRELLNEEWWYNNNGYSLQFSTTYLNTIIQISTVIYGGPSIEEIIKTYQEIKIRVNKFCMKE